MSKAKSKTAKPPKYVRKSKPEAGELSDDALEQVAGGASVGEKIATVAEMTDVLQADLQDASAKQQRMFQTLSNIVKSQHQTQQAIIKNLKG